MDDIQRLRSQQIQSLRAFFPHTNELAPNLFDVPLFLNNGNNVSVRLILPSNFPQTRPTISIPDQNHHMLDRNYTIIPSKIPSLQNWTMHTDLGALIQLVAHHLNNPQPQAMRSSSPSQHRNSTPQAQMPVANTTANCREINDLDVARMQQLMDNPEEFSVFFFNLDVVKNCAKLREEVDERNKALQAKNNEIQGELQQLRGVEQEKQKSLQELSAEYDALQNKRDELQQRVGKQALLSRLAEKIDEAEEQADEVQSKYEYGGDYLAYVRSYMPLRTKYHLRTIKSKNF